MTTEVHGCGKYQPTPPKIEKPRRMGPCVRRDDK
jgi:hypothetical protein